MEGRITCGLWMAVFLLGCRRLSAFNLDTENYQRKDGDPGSLFGFSLAMHRQLDPVDKRILLVGSPRAKALSGQTSKVTGGLYNCDITSPSPTCNRVIFDNNEDPTKESKENQWMGVTVSSQGPGGKVMTCAHRYELRTRVNTKTEGRTINGRCTVLSQSLTIDPYDSVEGDRWQFCDGRTQGHERFGSCQQGISATFDKDYHYLIFGAPGAYNWKGVVHMAQNNESLSFDDGPFEVGDEYKRDPKSVPVPDSSYLGFSLDSGKDLTEDHQLTVVAGAPRANHSGEVVLLKKDEDRGHSLVVAFTLEGEGLASSFGYDLTVLDVNADGWQDIVVGAPQYFEKDGKIGGAVYVYVNDKGKWDKVKPTRIDGPQDSMFGLAVENLGDINQDGFDDFAVGAPYADDGAGNVHIYHGAGTPTGLRSKIAAQVLSGKSLGVKQFGYSFAGNMDLDRNSYPDLAVGSLSDAVFVFRARPVINIEKEIKFTPKEIDLTKKNCGNNFCLTIEACFSYTASPKSYAPKLREDVCEASMFSQTWMSVNSVTYSLEADADKRKIGLIPRVTLSDPSEHTYKSNGTVTLNSKGKKECITRQLMIQDNIRDKLRGIPIDVSVEIQDAKRKRRQSSPELQPVMDAYEPSKTRFEVNFLKEGCGNDNVCKSNLQVKYRYGYRTTDEDTFTPLALEGGMPVISLSNQKYIALEVTVSNLKADDAHEASLIASFPRSVTYAAYRAPEKEGQVNCRANTNGSQVKCELGNPFRRDLEMTFYIILGTSGISPDISELEIDLQLETTSNQGKIAPVKAKAKVVVMLQLFVSGLVKPSQVSFAAEVKGETAVSTENDTGSAITHQFRILNLGKRLQDGDATLIIDWPKTTGQGKPLLYLMKISATGVEQMECTPKGEIHHLNMQPSHARPRRAAGKIQESDQGTFSHLFDRKKSETLSCGSGARCVTIRCPLRGMDSNAILTVDSRLWKDTFREDYPELHHVDVIVRASLHVSGTAKNTELQNAKTQVRLTVFPERHEARYGGGVPWWIIVLSILFLLMLLALLAFLLWKCGLFGKKNKEHPSKRE